MLPKPISPMEPQTKAEPFNSPSHLFQVKWDGVRCLSYLDHSQLTLINRRYNNRTNQYPELVKELAFLASQEVILDGEIVAFDTTGKPNFRRVLKRDLVKSVDKAKSLVKNLPVSYLVFDILFHRGENICQLPLSRRQEILAAVLKPLTTSPIIKQVDCFPHDGVSLFNVVELEGLEGIVAKDINSPYVLGHKSHYWYKIKCWRELKAVICGLLIKQHQVRSLLLGAFEEEKLLYIGNVASGLSEEHKKLLLTYGKENNKKAPSVINPPGKMSGEIIWVEPELVVLVKYLEWTGDLKLRSPQLVDFLADSPESCVMT